MDEIKNQDEAGCNTSCETVKFVGYGTVIAFVLAWLMHYIGNAFGGMYVLEGVLPINESIWEHTKIAFYPSIFVTLVPWCDFVKRIEWKKRFVLAAVSGILSKLIVWVGYYGLKYGLNREGMLIDCCLLIVGLLVGFARAAMLADANIYDWVKWVCIIYIVAMVVFFYIFAFAPVDLPLFMPPVQG